ncbi:MAG: MBL fold metallo-hydrolase [Bacteroidota bacterium]|nr:MBL fold metallo-hydrolase [Bacteroidota bacterium]
MGATVSDVTLLRRHLCILDVGHGNSTVIISGAEGVVVVDAGQRSVLLEFLLQQQITRIQSVYLSHADADHLAGLLAILGAGTVSIGHVYVNSDSTQRSQTWDDLLYELDHAHNDGSLEFRTELVAGHHESLEGGVSIEVHAPSRYLVAKGPGSLDKVGNLIRTNSISAVLSVSVSGKRLVLLPADIDSVGLADLFRTPKELGAPILVYPHHGGVTGSAASQMELETQLLAAVKPRLVVFSIGRGMYSNPNPDAIRLVCRSLPGVRVICTQLSTHCANPLMQSTATHLPTAHASGRESGKCCGGTIVVPLDDVSEVLPHEDLHGAFIRKHAPTALCMFNTETDSADEFPA